MNDNMHTRWSALILRSIATGLLLGIGFLAGFVIRGEENPPAVSAGQDNGIRFALLTQVHNLVSEHYVRELPEDTQLEYAAIRGYLATLNDPYTFFNDPPVTSSERDSLAGRYGGIGVEIKRNESGFIQLFPYPESPAARAGVLVGDILMAIDGNDLALDERLDVIRQMTRGEIVEGENSGIEVTVRQPDSQETRIYFIPFEEIRVPSLVWRVLQEDASVGYIHITSFTARTPEEFQEAITELEAVGIQGLILDLRNNPGGLLKESIDIADEFLNSGTILIEQYRAEQVVSGATDGGIAVNIPMVVIVNRGSASAAEVVAGALQNNERALLIGQRTLGKGSVQFIFGLDDGSSIHITSSIWLTPDGSPLEGIGLTPDIEMIPDENNRDVELGEALRQLRAVMIVESEQ